MQRPLRAFVVALALVAVAAAVGRTPMDGANGPADLTAAVADAPATFDVNDGASFVPASPPAETAAAPTVPAPPLARVAVPPQVAPLVTRVRPDVLILGENTFSDGAIGKLAAFTPDGQSLTFRAGTLSVSDKPVGTVGIDPSTFRSYAAQGTAEADAVWNAVARGEVVASHAKAKELGLVLGSPVAITPRDGGPARQLRLGAFATAGMPSTDLVVDDQTGRSLGLPTATGMLLTAGKGGDPIRLADQVRTVTGKGATVDLLTPPAANPVAFLSGSKAAKAFGAFSYRYFPDGTIAPDARWVKENIVTATVPIMGKITCHRLMIPQLRGALQDVVDAGLADTLHHFDGCYVPRFIERNPSNSISLHTWGIAIDMDAATNYRGIAGTMDPEVVNIFKRWGFRWGGDWKYTDPMHFEIAALLTQPKKK